MAAPDRASTLDKKGVEVDSKRVARRLGLALVVAALSPTSLR